MMDEGVRYRCGDCGRTRPASETATCPGTSKGNYRRAGRHITRRVCRDCVQGVIDFCREEPGRRSINTSAFAYTYAADKLGIDWAGLRRDNFDARI